jgi:hypothetical protein
MNNHLPHKASPNSRLDIDLVLTFLADYHSLEAALVRAGFTKAGPATGNGRPDWARFARHIEGKFDPESDPALEGTVYYLLADSGNPKFFKRRPALVSDIVWLTVLIQELRNRLLLGIHLGEAPSIDPASLGAALFILGTWAEIDPTVESMFIPRTAA